MSEFRGTKGGFSLRESTLQGREKSYDIIADDDKWIASVLHADLFNGTEEEVLANAKLFVAAKDLLEALQSLRFRLGQALELGLITVNKTETETDMRIAEKAIKTALGDDK